MGDKEQVDAKQQQAPAEAQPAVPPPANPPPPQHPAPAAANPEDDEEMSKSDRIMAAATIVIAIGTLVSAGAICFQWREMVNGGADTTAIKLAAQKQADAAQQFADTAGDISGGIGDAVGKLDAQAQTAAKSIKATQSAMRLDQRAWVGLAGIFIADGPIAPGKVLRINIVFKNTGKTPAFQMKGFNIVEPLPSGALPTFDYSTNHLGRYGLLQPNGEAFATLTPVMDPTHTEGRPLPQDDFNALKSGTTKLFIHGRFSYEDVFGKPHWTEYCFVLQSSLTAFGGCEVHNNADRDQAKKAN